MYQKCKSRIHCNSIDNQLSDEQLTFVVHNIAAGREGIGGKTLLTSLVSFFNG